MGEKVEAAAPKPEGEKKPAAAVAPAAVPAVVDGGAKKEDGGAITAIYKIDMHCEGCAKKIKRAVQHVKDVITVKTDCGTNKLTVIGKMDVLAVKEKLELKTKKKVELISPQPKKDGGAGEKKAEEKKPEQNKTPEEKPKESTVDLKIRLHCEGCIQKIRRIILKINGVQSVNLDGGKDLVTVKGTMDVKQLQPYLKDKLKRTVEIVVPPKKEEPAAEKKKEDPPAAAAVGGEKKKEEGGGEKKEKEGGGGEKKEKEAGGGEAKPTPPPAAAEGGVKSAEVVNKLAYYGGYPYEPLYYEAPMQYHSYSMEANPSYYNPNHGYIENRYDAVPIGDYYPQHMQQPHDQPQMFSNENPNACSVM
ncbi:heavy metal-associated isoprenylated plant protein 5-like isoform X2 [Cucurbita pepo subsp. pepo]|uniref:heavy metal-associated isoprenylated plant protein 5-like isoform X2 n=1 Tax=Cucurbita pepo subsp. pepo TaxID=3664 RepID=UPI000C9D8B84|nr:heavy metal-associated isoprenylated plant protein 5-like isoform X2 [Cucurbita pepo subsp. pepo]